MITIKLFELKTKEQEEMFSEIYDNFWKPCYDKLTQSENLICVNINTNELHLYNVLKSLYNEYEGYTIQVKKDNEIIYGGVFDDTWVGYMKEYIPEIEIPCYTCWCGGIEVNDEYLTLKQAENLKREYVDEGYDDVVICKVDI